MYQYVLWLHFATLIVTAIGVVTADHYGFSWLRGKHKTLDPKRLVFLHRFVGAGITLMVLTGLYMFWGQRAYLLYEPGFLIKMAFVGLLIGNSFVIGNLSRIATRSAFKEITRREKLLLVLSGAASSTGWLGAFIAAKLFFS